MVSCFFDKRLECNHIFDGISCEDCEHWLYIETKRKKLEKELKFER